jgi:hypothetical protein
MRGEIKHDRHRFSAMPLTFATADLAMIGMIA